MLNINETVAEKMSAVLTAVGDNTALDADELFNRILPGNGEHSSVLLVLIDAETQTLQSTGSELLDSLIIGISDEIIPAVNLPLELPQRVEENVFDLEDVDEWLLPPANISQENASPSVVASPAKAAVKRLQKIGIQATPHNAKYGFVNPNDTLLFGGAIHKKPLKPSDDTDILLDYLASKARAFSIPRLDSTTLPMPINGTNSSEDTAKQAVLSVKELIVTDKDDTISSDGNRVTARTAASHQAKSGDHPHLSSSEVKTLNCSQLAQRINALSQIIENLSQEITKIEAVGRRQS